MYSKTFRIFGCGALIFSAVAVVFPEAALAVPKVKVTGTAKVNVTNIPSVNLNGTPTVRLETGSTVALQPGSAVSLQPGSTVSLQPGTTVSLPPGAAVALQPGAAVALQPGAAVALQPGSTVGLAPGSTVSLPTGTKVGLETGTTVKLDPTATVSVQDNAAREAVQIAFSLSMVGGEFFDSDARTVPAGKILVIEYLSCSARLDAGSMYADLTTTAGGISALHSFFPAPGFNDGSGTRFIISASTRLYTDPLDTVTLTVRRTNSSGIVSPLPCSLSGYYVDA